MLRAQSGSHGQESSKEKKAASGSKGHSSHKATIGSDISILPDCFPITEPGVTLSRPLKAKMLLFILKCFALYQENNKRPFCSKKRLLFSSKAYTWPMWVHNFIEDHGGNRKGFQMSWLNLFIITK